MSAVAPAVTEPTNDPVSPVALLLRDAAHADLLTPEEEQALGRRVQAGQRARERLRRADLSAEERVRLEAVVADADDARQRFVAANQRLVLKVARRFRGQGLDLEDLIQEGNLGLMRAVERFDPERGLRFSTYAVWWIRQAIQRAVEERGRLIRLPGRAAEQAVRLRHALDRLTVDLERPADLTEAADLSGLDSGRAVELAQLSLRPISLEVNVDDDGELTLGDVLATDHDAPEEILEQTAVSDIVREGLAQVPARARRVLELRFGLADGQPRTLIEVGELLGVSRERARQLEAEGLRVLRRVLRPLRPVLVGE